MDQLFFKQLSKDFCRRNLYRLPKRHRKTANIILIWGFNYDNAFKHMLKVG